MKCLNQFSEGNWVQTDPRLERRRNDSVHHKTPPGCLRMSCCIHILELLGGSRCHIGSNTSDPVKMFVMNSRSLNEYTEREKTHTPLIDIIKHHNKNIYIKNTCRAANCRLSAILQNAVQSSGWLLWRTVYTASVRLPWKHPVILPIWGLWSACIYTMTYMIDWLIVHVFLFMHFEIMDI